MATATALHPSQAIGIDRIPAGQTASTHPATDHGQIPAGTVHRGPVTSILNFYAPPQDGSVPFNYVQDPPEGQPKRNYGETVKEVEINDARGSESSVSLDKQAFALLQGYPHNEAIDWNDEESIKTLYYPEVERILLENTGGNRVLIFDHTIRRATGDRQAVMRAHIDQTPRSARQRVEFHLPDEAEKLLQGRYRIINVWRPLNGAVESNPLGFADSSSVPDTDMVPVEHRYPNRTGETAGVKYNPEHRWYYWSGMTNDERILLQCADSKQTSTRVPHSAFALPNAPGAKPRESIEVRALVFGG